MRSFGLTVMLAVAAMCGTAHAQLVRSAVSIEGLDTNPCTVAQPCRTFAAAMAQTNDGGEIVVLASGGYSPFTITQRVKVIAPEGVHAGVSPTSGTGISINVLSTPVETEEVVLEGLSLNGMGANIGIHVTGGRAIVLRRITADGFTGSGIAVTLTATNALGGSVYVADSSLRRNNYGISVMAVGSTSLVAAAVEGSHLLHNVVGLSVRDKAQAALRDSVVAFNTSAGVDVSPATATTAVLDVESSAIVHNLVGIRAGGFDALSMLRLSNSVLAHNRSAGIVKYSGANVLTRANNTVENNTAVFDGTFTAN